MPIRSILNAKKLQNKDHITVESKVMKEDGHKLADHLIYRNTLTSNPPELALQVTDKLKCLTHLGLSVTLVRRIT